MFEVVAIVGPEYKAAPTYDKLRGSLLQGEKSDHTSQIGKA